MTGTALIRPARKADAEAVARLANALDRDQGGGGRVYDAAVVRHDGFGDGAPVRFLVAVWDGRIVGYAMFGDFYDSDRAARGAYLNDLYVEPGARRRGIGRRLLAAVAADTARRGGAFVWTGVYARNRTARAFYAAAGGRDENARIVQIDGERFAAMAAESAPRGLRRRRLRR